MLSWCTGWRLRQRLQAVRSQPWRLVHTSSDTAAAAASKGPWLRTESRMRVVVAAASRYVAAVLQTLHDVVVDGRSRRCCRWLAARQQYARMTGQ
jgi:hypothetical protein